ncbi:MAG: penicillin-binding protein 2 [Kiritimatiellae bacterium]|nr:penicillin-binding protein 2 [Kiritimatiellia bacterium]
MVSVFHSIFLVSFAGVLLLLLAWSIIRGCRGGWIAASLFGLVAVLLLLYQAFWQIRGGGDVALMQFKRNHDPRPPVRETQRLQRGRLLDRRGELLAGPRAGEKWGHEVPLGAAAFHVIGYDIKGRGTTGLERVFASRLWGVAPPSDLSELLLKAKPEDLTLTLDAHLQQMAYGLLKERKGAVVALDPRNGEILALVSSPAPLESALATAERDRKNAPMLNRATQGLYPPGSVFKIFSAALALEKGKGGRYVCPPGGWAPGAYTRPIRDTHPQPAGIAIPIEKAFAESSNIWFAKAVTACGWKAVDDAIGRNGFREGLTLAACGAYSFGTKAGVVPELYATPNRLAYLGFGQGDLLLTPVHIAAMTATIANDGAYAPLHLEKGRASAPRTIWSRAVARRVKALMRQSVLSGTSKGVELRGLEVCGKTGTAENSGRDHAWFTCFAPAEKPEIVITVLIENGGFGAATALPVAKELLRIWAAKR